VELKIALCSVRSAAHSSTEIEAIGGLSCEELVLSEQLTAQLTALAAGQDALIAIAMDRKTLSPLKEASGTVPRLLVVENDKAVSRVIRLLQAGFSAAEIAYPPLFTPDRLLAESPADLADKWSVRLDPRTLEDNEPWLTIEADAVVAASQALSPLEIEAARGRTGMAKTDQPHLLIGPCNWAGQGEAWAKAVQAHVPGFVARNLAIRHAYRPGPGFLSDVTLDRTLREMALTLIDMALDVILPATHVLIEDMQTLLAMGRQTAWVPAPEDLEREVETLLQSGREVALIIHGSAARTPSRHAALFSLSPFADPTELVTSKHESRTKRLFEALERLSVPLFVATVDMLDYVEDATWLPIVISEADFAPVPPWEPQGRLKVAHMPSDGFKKGSIWVDQQLTHLDRLGVIEYQRHFSVHPNLVPGLLRQVDVVVDQVSLGNVATLANQTMAAGRLSLGLLAPHVRRRYPEDPPVISVDPTTLSDVVWQIAKDPQLFEGQAKAGPGFARRYHDGRAAAKTLEPWLQQRQQGGAP